MKEGLKFDIHKKEQEYENGAGKKLLDISN